MDSNTATLIGSIISAITGIIGALVGAKVGGEKSYKGAMDAVTKQIQFEKDKLLAEVDENKRITALMVNNFCEEEIRLNFKHIFGSNNCQDIKDIFSKTNYKFCYTKESICFDEFNKVKLEMIKNASDKTEEISSLYKAFKILSLYDCLADLNSKDFETVKTIINKYSMNYV